MSSGANMGSAARQLFDAEEVEGVLSGAFYKPDRDEPPAEDKAERAKPTHYKVICISMYVDALARLDEMVMELKRRGYTKANRSALIRHALDTMDLDEVPKGL
jgi:hypothetical protein